MNTFKRIIGLCKLAYAYQQSGIGCQSTGFGIQFDNGRRIDGLSQNEIMAILLYRPFEKRDLR